MNLSSFLRQAAGSSGGNPARGLNVSRQSLVRIAARRLCISEASVLASPELILSTGKEALMQADFQALLDGRPEAYVLGDIPFLEWDFSIDERALIPRPETEDLCARVIAGFRGQPAPEKVLDLCCGSGVMGLSMALAFPESRVLLTDVSHDALALCRENILAHGVQARTATAQGDLWDAVSPEERFHLIVANPPYVATEDPVASSVLSNEPHLALFSGDKGMGHIKQILSELPLRLLPGGRAAFELGHRHQEQLDSWLAARPDYQNFHWEQDLFGVSRFLFYDGRIAPAKA